jgi:hypothetical protein
MARRFGVGLVPSQAPMAVSTPGAPALPTPMPASQMISASTNACRSHPSRKPFTADASSAAEA